MVAGQRRQIFPDLAEKWKFFVRSQIWPRQTDPMKGQLFAKKGVKYNEGKGIQSTSVLLLQMSTKVV